MTRSIVVGDIHGCYYTLMRLLDKVDFDREKDHLYCLGDLIGKGPYSSKVLNFLLTVNNISVTLGNHDLAWMFHCWVHPTSRPDFVELATNPDCEQWLWFLKKQDFLLDTEFGVLVHASVHPSWTVSEARRINDELVAMLRQDPKVFLGEMKVKPIEYKKTGIERQRAEFYILTHCRYYRGDQFDLTSVDVPENVDATPWFSKDLVINKNVIFGHWATLKGRDLPHVTPLDGGAVYGGKLMAFIGETGERFSVDRDKDDN